MVARSILLGQLRQHPILCATRTNSLRFLATKPAKSVSTAPPAPEKSWLTRQVEASPTTRKVFVNITNLFGYGSPKQMAGRRTFAIYEQICATTPDKDRDFWQKDCYLPPTFQSWFTVTNLHIWMLTVRFRALPVEHGRFYEQALIDHFFLDIEDRIRTVLQPPAEPTQPYTFETSFYVNPNAPSSTELLPNGKPKPRGRAPDRLVTRQMKIFKEQWAGMGLSLDLGLVKGDTELAGAIWRNLLGARGAQGIAYSDSSSSEPAFRRSVNLVGGEVVNVSKVNLEKEEMTDDGSGVHDFSPSEVDKYLTYPRVMLDVVGYIRRELVRLESLSDEEIVSGDWEKLRFGQFKL